MTVFSSSLDVQIKDPDVVAGLLAKAFQRAMTEVPVGLGVNFVNETIEVDLDAGSPELHRHLRALISEHYRINVQSVSIDSAGADASGVEIPVFNVVFTPLEVPVAAAQAPAVTPAPAPTPTPAPRPAPIGQRAPVQAPAAAPVSAGLPEPVAPAAPTGELLGRAPFVTGSVPPPDNPQAILPRRKSRPRPEAMDARLAVAEQLQDEVARGAQRLNYMAAEDDEVPRRTLDATRDMPGAPPPPRTVPDPRFSPNLPSKPEVVVTRGSLF